MICLYCGHLLGFNADESLREASDAEMVELAGTPELIEAQKFRKAWVGFGLVGLGLAFPKSKGAPR